MRRFELIEGNSSKFWEVETRDTELTVTFGRIGTNGQTKTKAFASHEAALAEEVKLIKEKTGKGYRETTSAGGPSEPALAAAPPVPPPSEPARPEPPFAPPAAAGIEWPGGGFAWTPKWRAQLPIVRGIHVPEFTPSEDPLARMPPFDDRGGTLATNYGYARQRGAWADAPPGGTPWSEAEAAEKLRPDRLREANPDAWRELLVQCVLRDNYCRCGTPRNYSAWAIDTAIRLHSLAHATGVLLDAAPDVDGNAGWREVRQAFHHLRHALAAAPESDYLAARRTAEGYRNRGRRLMAMVSYLFPEIGAWAEEAAAPGLVENDLGWLDDTVLSVGALRRLYRNRTPNLGYKLPVLLLQLHLHGESAFPLLRQLLVQVPNDPRLHKQIEFGKFLKFLAQVHTPALIPALVERMRIIPVRETLDALAERWPAAVLRSVATRAFATRIPEIEQRAALLAQRHPDGVAAVLADCTEDEREYLQGLLAAPSTVDEAPPEALPELLRNPPWTRKARPKPLPTLDIEPPDEPDAMVWPEGLRERWRRSEPGNQSSILSYLRKKEPDLTLETLALRTFFAAAAHDRIRAGETPGPEDFQSGSHYPSMLFWLPDHAAMAVWNGVSPKAWWPYGYEVLPVLPALPARYELRCLPGLAAFAAAFPEEGMPLLLPFRAAGLAPLAARALAQLKKAKPHAMAWLRAHPEAAALGLIPAAFGKDKPARNQAQAALRWLANQGFEADLRRAGARFGAAAAKALDELLSADPALAVPARMPLLPTFFAPLALPRPVLRDGGALPVAAVQNLGLMLAISKLHEPYAGLDTVKAACTARSLGEFAWALYEAWDKDGAPAKENLAFLALGLLGDDATARKLAAKIRVWPTEGLFGRAVNGLDLLAAMGHDGAFTELHGIAHKVKSKPLQNKAREKLGQLADSLGLTAEQLADRLIPDLDLDARGTAELDFGPRRFTVSFDEALKPFVTDDTGARLKDLPKPGQRDDAEKAEAAVERFKALKKDAKAIASVQVARLEQAMCTGRRWTAGEFRRVFLEHPLMGHLARRLVWGVYRDGAWAEAFRVAEDLTLADCHDEGYALPEDEAAELGVAHPLELPEDANRAFAQVFADYEILQPFRQLGRETYTLTDGERQSGRIERFKDRKIATGAVRGLMNRGWEKGEEDGGYVWSLLKRLPGGLNAVMSLEPGLHLGDASGQPVQNIPEIGVRRQGFRDDGDPADLAGLPPVVASELIRDADLLALAKP